MTDAMIDVLFGCKSPRLWFAQDSDGEVVEVEMTKRDWNVAELGDPEARRDKAEEELGDGLDGYAQRSMQWFVNKDENTAALCVYRSKQEQATR